MGCGGGTWRFCRAWKCGVREAVVLGLVEGWKVDLCCFIPPKGCRGSRYIEMFFWRVRKMSENEICLFGMASLDMSRMVGPSRSMTCFTLGMLWRCRWQLEIGV